MPLPAPLETVTAEGTWMSPVTGLPLAGSAELAAVNPVLSPAGDVLLTTEPDRKALVAGEAQWAGVLFSDSTGISAPVLYRLRVIGDDGYYEDRRVQLLKAAAVAGVIQLADVATAVTGPAAATYLLAASVGTVGGPAGPLDATGKVPAAQLPVAGGSIPTTIVDAKGDLVTATAPDTPARLGVGADGRVLMADAAQATGLKWQPLAIGDIPSLQATLDGKVDESLLDAAGDLVVATAADTPARLPVGTDGQTLVVDTGQPARIKYVDRQPAVYPLAADGLISASAELAAFTGTFTLGAVWYVRMPVPAGKPITNCVTAVHQAGTLGAGGENSMAVYTDAGVFVAQTVTDNNLWTTTGAKIKALSAPIAAQTVDRYVYVGIMVNGYSANPFFMFVAGSSGALMFNGGFGSGKRRVIINAGSSTSWDASFNPASAGGSGSGFMPFIALS